MSLNFQCPSCGITLQAEPEFAGKMVKCPSCSTKIEIPEDFAQGMAETDNGAGTEQEPLQSSLPELNLGQPHGNHPASVNLWMALGIGLCVTGLIYLIMFLIPDQKNAEGLVTGPWIKQFFVNRGWPQYASTFLSGWCVGVLILKAFNIQKQRRAMLIQALPNSIAEEVNVHNLKEFHDNLLNFPKKLRNTYIVNRIRKALEFFYIRQSNPEVSQMIAAQSEVDANKVAGSYSMVKVFLWAIPIMGFIGTVLGIGAAIGEFGNVLAGGGGAEVAAEGAGGTGDIMEALTPVLGSMGMAFDTTLLALVFSIILAFPASALQSKEEDVVTDVDEYCVDNFLKRLSDGSGGTAQFEGDAELLKAVGEAMAENQKAMMGKFESVQKEMATNLEKQTTSHQKIADAIDKQLEGIEKRTEKYETRLDEGYFAAIAAKVNVLSEGIHNLNDVLKDLNGKQIVVKKKGLFG